LGGSDDRAALRVMNRDYSTKGQVSLMIQKRIAAIVTVLLLAASILMAQASKLDGMWEGKMDHEGVIETITFDLHAKADALTGKVFRNGQELGDVSSAKVEGKKIYFKVDFLMFEGTLEDEKLNLTVTVYNGNKFSVSAARKTSGS
jgi:hypothetical protein